MAECAEQPHQQVATTSGATSTTIACYGGRVLSVNGALSYSFSNELGSISASLNASGTVTASFGFVRQRCDAVSWRLPYTGNSCRRQLGE